MRDNTLEIETGFDPGSVISNGRSEYCVHERLKLSR
jgi:hypothetical protein